MLTNLVLSFKKLFGLWHSSPEGSRHGDTLWMLTVRSMLMFVFGAWHLHWVVWSLRATAKPVPLPRFTKPATSLCSIQMCHMKK